MWKKRMVAGLLAGLTAGLCPAAEMVLDRQGGWEVVQSDDGGVATLCLVQLSDGVRTPLASVELPTATVTNSYWDEYAGLDEATGRPLGALVTRVDTVAADYRFQAFVNDNNVYWEDWAEGTARLWTAPCKTPGEKTLLAEAAAGVAESAFGARPWRHGAMWREVWADGSGMTRMVREDGQTRQVRASARARHPLVFNANGGKFEDGRQVVDDWNEATNDGLYEFLYTRYFQFPSLADHAFDGWYSAATGGTPLKDGDPVTVTNLYAHWVPTSGTPLAEATDCDKLTFTTDGDVPWFGQKTTSHDGTDAARSGQLPPAHPWFGSSTLSATVTGPGTISFWWKADFEGLWPCAPTMLSFLVDGTDKVLLNTGLQDWKQESFAIEEGTHELTWKYQAGEEYGRRRYRGLDCVFVDQIEWKWQGNQTVTFDARGGTCATATKTYVMWKPYGTLPDATREGYSFEGWFTAVTGGTRVTADDTVPEQETRTLYAHWKQLQTVTFDANGGSCPTQKAYYPPGEVYGSLPTATREGYLLIGWFTDDGVQVTATSRVASAATLTLHARWGKAVDGVGIAVTSVRQRFPWNGLVDIDYEVFCDDPDAWIWVVPEAFDREHERALVMETLTGDGANTRIKPGRHRMTWDAKADNPGAHSSALTVKMKGANASQTISFAAIGPQTPADRVELSATATSGLAVAFEVVSGPGVVTGNELTFTGAGTVEVRAVQAGNERWLPATATQAVVVEKVSFLVVDLSAGADAASYPVTELDAPPSGGFNTDEYKTTKLVLRRIKPGTFMMCGEYQTTLTKPYYIGVFEVTQKQWELVTGGKPSWFMNAACYEKRPVESVSWNMIRGNSGTYNWPGSRAVDANSFMGRLRARTGLEFDLPMEAQWEYACRAGTTSDYNNGGNSEDDLKKLGRYWYNGGKNYSSSCDTSAGTAEVGSYLPNAWGLYDMHGNVWEWCLDWYGSLTNGATDPVGPSSGSRRVGRGGGWGSYADRCTSSYRYGDNPSYGSYNFDFGFRLVRTLSNENKP